MSDGWVKLHRKILKNPLFADVPPEWLRIAMFILLSANHEPRKWYDGRENVNIPAGSFVTSSIKISKECKVGRTVVRNAVKYLDNSGFATIKTTSRYMVVTITNWKLYQDTKPTDDQVSNQVATKSQPTNDQVATNYRPQLKNVKELKEGTTDTNGQDALFALTPEKPKFDPDKFFDSEFWPFVWKKVGVGTARVSFRKQASTPARAKWITEAAIAQGPEIMARGSKSSRGTPILVSTWLNQERFDDDMTEIEAKPEDEEPW